LISASTPLVVTAVSFEDLGAIDKYRTFGQM
jgi:hypothetical protein